ncbi:ATP-binding protein [Cohnella zeiphila]|uniref:histidine kinase n=1 Tax=Cohnella zeiphila TaxID=2761120 RepID=A0A7X0VUB8_9BACL|nr:PAS domain S-box protein [Cohnella zeiphila]
MWQYTLLQIFIALMPIGALQFWLNHPARARYTPAFMAAASGVSMLLGMFHSNGLERFDLRMVPFLIGSLYGGIPGASVMTVLYVASHLGQIGDVFISVMLGVFLLGLVPFLFSLISTFQHAGLRGKLTLSMKLAAVAVLIPFIESWDFLPRGESILRISVSGIFVLVIVEACVACSVYLIESGLGRMRLESELRRVQAERDAETKRLRQFAELSPLAVLFVNEEDQVTYLNKLALEWLPPANRQEAAGAPYPEVFKPLGDEALAGAVGRVLRGEDQLYHMLRLGGRMYYVVVSEWKRPLDGRAEGAVLLAQDVTELQRLRDELGKMERLSLVGQMAASITHEIRNPMAVIRGFIQLLNERSQKDQQSYFHIILQELDRANGIINDFLSLAQNRIVEKSDCDLHELLEDLMPLIWADANMRGQSVELQLCERVDSLELNIKEIKQLVLNLSRNGMEAMNDKGVLRIETLDFPDSVELRVTDNGTGIPPEKLEHLFEPFYTTKTNGTGLGLALCLSIVERHRGKIRVESKLGEGTMFAVTFCKPGRDCW